MKRVLIDLAVVLAVVVAWHVVTWFCAWRVSWLWEWTPGTRVALIGTIILSVFSAEQNMETRRYLRSLGIDP